ncbi:MAG: threonine aldolase family protein [Bacillota bacterium]
MISFKNDYSEGAHERILNTLVKTNLEQLEGYGNDKYSKIAKDEIRKKIEMDDLDIHFVSGGTQANLTVISSALRSFESVISVDTGHINVHETGAIESCGYKINTCKSKDGKITISMIQDMLDFHEDEHMVKPKMVYISNATELGTFYTKEELKVIYNFCKSNDLYLFIDGARLGSAIKASKNLTLKDIAKYSDVFYIGATKNGGLIGEAIVIKNDKLKKNFRYQIKQKGGLLAKGRLLGIQFLELFKDNLYFDLASNANGSADKLRKGLKEIDCEFLVETKTNQLFPVFSNEIINELKKEFEFHIWEKIDKNKKAIRLVTSWATTDKMIDTFINKVKKIKS